MNPFIALYISVLLLLGACRAGSSQEAVLVSDQPNVIVIMTDDQGWGDLSIHGNKVIETPVLDKFAQQGVRINNFYVSPLCAPTRASLLTGRYNLRTGTRWVSDGLENMHPEEYTLAEMFQDAGYSTGCFGKWHNGSHFPFHPNQQGFDEFIGFCAGHWNNYFSTSLQHNGTAFPTQGYVTDVLTDQAIEFITNYRDQPFFCYIPYNVPHSPFQVPDAYFDKYYRRLDSISDENLRSKRASVYGMCQNVDDNVGRVLSTLDKLDLRDNTIVIYLSDNGPNGARYNGGMRGTKGSTHEGGTRVPFFIQWPGKLPANSTVEGLAAHIDILPTLAALCGIALPGNADLDGINLAPFLESENSTIDPRTLFFQQSDRELTPFRGAVRTDQYRLVQYPNYTGLYDLKNDPDESEDLSRERPALRDSLQGLYSQWFESMAEQSEDMTLIPLGFDNQIRAVLPAHESSFSGNVRFKEGHGWAHDWLIKWSSPGDRISWKVDVEKPSTYKVYLTYTTAESNLGGVMQVENNRSMLTDTLVTAFNPEPIFSPDRVPRIEVYEKEWAQMYLGTMDFVPGVQTLTLKAPRVVGDQVAEIKNITLVQP